MSSLYLSREEEHEEINTVLSCCCSRVISEARRWDCEALIGPECVLAQRPMLLCDKGVRADKHVCVKWFKDELNSDIKVQFERKRDGHGGWGGWLYSWHLLCSRDVFISSCTLESAMEKGAVGNTDISCSALNWGSAQVPLAKWM